MQDVIQYTVHSIGYTLSVALPYLLRYPVSNVKSSVAPSDCKQTEPHPSKDIKPSFPPTLSFEPFLPS
jgi:hypothetical protein